MTSTTGRCMPREFGREVAAMQAEAIDPSSPDFEGGFGRWVYRLTAMSRVSDVSELHVTSLHSSTWLDTRAEPWVFQITSACASSTARVTDLWSHLVEPRHPRTTHGDWRGTRPTTGRE